jgi:DNA-directed RNA polymerase subunit D
MEIVKETDEKIVLREKISQSLINAIRRSVDEIPTLAIDEVEIFKNDSTLYDEVLSHRIGLVPLKTENKMGEKTVIEFSIQKKGKCTVYSEDIKGGGEVVYGKMPLTILENNQEIEIVCTAKMGKGVEHSKYSPGIIYYRALSEIKLGNPKIDRIVQDSNKGVVKPEKKSGKWLCDISESEIDDVLKIDNEAVNDSKEILIFIESFGHLKPRAIFLKSIEALQKNLGEFEKNIK